MTRSLYVLAIYLGYMFIGWAGAPFVLSLGYVWVDTFTPQQVATVFLNQVPASFIMAVSAVVSYFAMDRSYMRVSTITVLIVVFTAWITVTTFGWAVVPNAAREKWDYAWKAVAFAAFLPFVFRSRVQIEAFLLTWIFALGLQVIPFGVKTLISGGGYGMNLGVVAGNSNLSEGSTLASVALCLVPLLFHFYRHSVILPRSRIVRVAFLSYGVLCFAAAIGTYERTALVSMLVIGVFMWWRSRRKVVFGLSAVAVAAVIAYFAAGAWSDRIKTTADYASEGSALGRILVWQWTLEYVGSHPLGGGFDVYRIDTIVFPANTETGKIIVVNGKAFHSSWFEVLGEHGWPGLFLFVSILGACLLQLQAVAKRSRGLRGLEWVSSLAYSLQISLCSLLAGASFVGIAFQPMIWYLVVASTCTYNYLKHVDKASVVEAREARRAERFGSRRIEAPAVL